MTLFPTLKTIFVFLLVASVTSAKGQNVFPTCPARLLPVAPKVDGILDTNEWKDAHHVTTFLDRVTGKPSEDATEAWIGYTKTGIHIAFYCHDTKPEGIIAREIIPNSTFQGEDFVAFTVNTYGNRSFDQLSKFSVNALGTKNEQIAGGRTGKREWRGEWKTSTSRAVDGWICEIEIPWQILNYPDKPKANFDFNLIRHQGRSLYEQSFANARQNPLPELQAIWEGVEPPKPPKAKVQYLAYAAPEIENGEVRSRFGLDARYAFTPSFNGLMTISPDFKNIEDVIAGIDFVRTERYLNETRPFFNEGGDFLSLPGEFGNGPMFYSRRIREFDMGVKTYGQVTPNLGVGALVTANFSGQKAMVFNANKTISATENAIVYGTYNSDATENHAIGFNYYKRRGAVGLDIGMAMEKDSGSKTDTAGSIGLDYQRPGFFAVARYNWVTPEFNPALAYIPWQNRRGGYVFAEFNRQMRSGPIRNIGGNFEVVEFRTYDGVLQQGGYNGAIYGSTRSDIQAFVSRDRFKYSGSLDETTSYGLTFNVSNRFRRFGVNYTDGIQGDNPSRYYGVNAEYRVGKNIDLSLRQSVLELEGTSRQSVGTVAYQISSQDLLSSRVAWTGAGTNAYLSYRHAGYAGTEYYVILGDPNAAKTSNRLSLKVVWAF